MGIALHIEGTVQDIFDPVLRHTQQMNIGGDLANLGFERRTVQPGIRTAEAGSNNERVKCIKFLSYVQERNGLKPVEKRFLLRG